MAIDKNVVYIAHVKDTHVQVLRIRRKCLFPSQRLALSNDGSTFWAGVGHFVQASHQEGHERAQRAEHQQEEADDPGEEADLHPGRGGDAGGAVGTQQGPRVVTHHYGGRLALLLIRFFEDLRRGVTADVLPNFLR